MDKDTSESTAIPDCGEEPREEGDTVSHDGGQEAKHEKTQSEIKPRSVSVKSPILKIQPRQDSIIIHLDGENSPSTVGALIAEQFAKGGHSNVELKPKEEDKPDTGQSENHVPELEEIKEETEPLVRQETIASITVQSERNHEQNGHQTQSKIQHISVQACSMIVGILAMILPSIWLSVFVLYLMSKLLPGFDPEVFNQIELTSSWGLSYLTE